MLHQPVPQTGVEKKVVMKGNASLKKKQEEGCQVPKLAFDQKVIQAVADSKVKDNARDLVGLVAFSSQS